MDIDREHYSDNDDSPMVSEKFIFILHWKKKESSVIFFEDDNNSFVPQKMCL